MNQSARTQQLAALQKGNMVRSQRAADKREIKQQPKKEALQTVANILLMDELPLHWERATVKELLYSVKYVKQGNTAQILEEHNKAEGNYFQIRPTTRLDQMPARTRKKLASRIATKSYA